MDDKKYRLLKRQYEKKSKEFDRYLLNTPTKENREDFTDLKKLFSDEEVDIIFNESKVYTRISVAEALLGASKYFNKRNKKLKVFSSYRTLSDQKERFIRRYKEFKNNYPEKTKPELLDLANTFTAGIPVLASHTAGAAVDVILLDNSGDELNFGSSYPKGIIESITDFPELSEDAKKNRRLLKEGMEKFGFVNYPFEYWHYSIGDVCAAYLSGEAFAKYGPVEFDLNSNNLTFLDSKEHSSYFKI